MRRLTILWVLAVAVLTAQGAVGRGSVETVPLSGPRRPSTCGWADRPGWRSTPARTGRLFRPGCPWRGPHPLVAGATHHPGVLLVREDKQEIRTPRGTARSLRQRRADQWPARRSPHPGTHYPNRVASSAPSHLRSPRAQAPSMPVARRVLRTKPQAHTWRDIAVAKNGTMTLAWFLLRKGESHGSV
jgi:hypothetical protein